MKIGISTRGLNQGSYAISTIILNLTRAIIELTPQSHEIFLYLNDPDFETYFVSSIQKRSVKLNNRLIWDHVWLPPQLKKDRIDIAIFMKGTFPLMLPCDGAVIFHDLGYFDDQLQPYKSFETIYMKKMMARAAHQAAQIFTDSEYTKKESVKIFGVPRNRITVCYQNCSPIYQPITHAETLNAVKTRYNLPSEYIFCPTSLSPRKNLNRILNAFENILDQIPQHLVITGGQSWKAEHLIERIETNFNHRVHILGAVQEIDMPVIYNLASFTLYPSLLEGFGFPILEAFRCGCPVLTSNLSSMPEVAGNAAYLVNPYDEDQISDGILKLSAEKELRQAFIEKGYERAKLFSWERTAKIILDRLMAFKSE